MRGAALVVNGKGQKVPSESASSGKQQADLLVFVLSSISTGLPLHRTANKLLARDRIRRHRIG
jgi:hypothetical protein